MINRVSTEIPVDDETRAALLLFNERLEAAAAEERAAKRVAKAERAKTEAAATVRKLNDDPRASAEDKAEAEAAYKVAVDNFNTIRDNPDAEIAKPAAEADADNAEAQEPNAADDSTDDAPSEEPTPEASADDAPADAADTASAADPAGADAADPTPTEVSADEEAPVAAGGEEE